MVKKIEEHLQLKDSLEGIFELLKLFFVILYVAHVCGLVIYYFV